MPKILPRQMLITQEIIQHRHYANYVKILKLQENLFHFHNRSTLPLNYHLFETSINATSFKLCSKRFSSIKSHGTGFIAVFTLFTSVSPCIDHQLFDLPAHVQSACDFIHPAKNNERNPTQFMGIICSFSRDPKKACKAIGSNIHLLMMGNQ
jgi:hypothetical protein